MPATTLAFCEPDVTCLRQEGHQVFIPDLGPLPSSLRQHSRRDQQTAVCSVEDESQTSWPVLVRVVPAQVSSAESAPLCPCTPAEAHPQWSLAVRAHQLQWLSAGTLNSLCVPKGRKVHREAVKSRHLNLGLHFLSPGIAWTMSFWSKGRICTAGWTLIGHH